MFIIQNYLERRARKIREWEKARDEWCAEGTYYRSPRDYVINHPYPVKDWMGGIVRIGLPVLGVLVLTGLFFYLIVSAEQKDTQTKKEHGTSSKCETFVKKGDTVGVAYGDFKGSKGTVIQQKENCEVDITLTDSTNTFEQCKAEDSDYTCADTLGNGRILHIDSSSNVIPL